MIKKFLKLATLTIILFGIYLPISTDAQERPELNSRGECIRNCGSVYNMVPTSPGSQAAGGDTGWATDWIVAPLFKAVGRVLMTISAGILALVGSFFDFIVKYSIIDMAKYLGDPEGLGGSISTAWRTLRDVANMFFIFVLLYVAFKAVFDLNFGNVGKSIANIIIFALLINFSLFFSKVVIDASNIVAVGFYNSIVSANTRTVAATTEAQTATSGGQTISSGYMRLLGLTSWYDAKVLTDPKNTTPDRILIIGIMSSIFMLITAVILLISAIMFAARFIILIFIMILSPLAFVAFIIPGQNKYTKEWWEALVNQSIFAPVFFALTWVAFKVASAPNFLGQKMSVLGGANSAELAKFIDVSTKAPNPGSLELVLNYVIVIGFAIAALVMSKKIATSTAGFTAISGGLAAGAAIASRQTLGRGMNAAVQSKWLRDKASGTGVGATVARAGLWTADKGARGSFDVRGMGNTGIAKAVGGEDLFKGMGSAGGKGGFNKAVEEKAKGKAEYAKRVYGQTEFEKEEFERKKKEEEPQIKADRANREAAARKEADLAEKKRKEYMIEQTNEFSTRLKTLNTDKKAKEDELKRAQDAGDKTKSEELSKDLGYITSRIAEEREAKKEKEKEIEETDAYKKLKEEADDKKEEAKEAKSKLKKKEIDDDELSTETQKLKKSAKERQEAFADRTRSGSPVSTGTGATIGAAIGGSIAGPIGMGIGVAIGAGIGSVLGGKLSEEFNWAGNRAAARKIKAEAGGKSKKERLADLAKEVAKEDEPATTPTTPSTGGGTPPKATT